MSTSEKIYDKFNIIIIGDGSVGKTSLLQRLVKNIIYGIKYHFNIF